MRRAPASGRVMGHAAQPPVKGASFSRKPGPSCPQRRPPSRKRFPRSTTAHCGVCWALARFFEVTTTFAATPSSGSPSKRPPLAVMFAEPIPPLMKFASTLPLTASRRPAPVRHFLPRRQLRPPHRDSMAIASTSPHCSSRSAIKRAGRAVLRRPTPALRLGASRNRANKMAMRARRPMEASHVMAEPHPAARQEAETRTLGTPSL